MEKGRKMIKIFLKIFFYILVTLVLIFITVFFLLKFSNDKWAEEFFKQDLVSLDLTEDNFKLEEGLEKKILDYNLSEDQYSFIEFTEKESLLLFGRALNDSFPRVFSVTEMALIPSYGDWHIYSNVSVFDYDLFWISFNLKKELAQSVDIFVDDVFVGDLSFKNIFLEKTISDINTGISSSFDLIVDGSFGNRVFENIELTEDSLVILSRDVSF